MERKEVKKFVDEQLSSMEEKEDVSELDSLDQVELIMRCEKEFKITIDESKIQNDWTSDDFIDYIMTQK